MSLSLVASPRATEPNTAIEHARCWCAEFDDLVSMPLDERTLSGRLGAHAPKSRICQPTGSALHAPYRPAILSALSRRTACGTRE